MRAADPVQARHIGVRRVRQATAAVAAAAVAGTGLLTWSLADQAAAQSPAVGTVTEHDDGGRLGWFGTDDGRPPGQLPGSGGSGPVHASSGGS